MWGRNRIRFFLDARVGEEIRQLRHHGDVGTGGVARGIATIADRVGGEEDGSYSTSLGEEPRDLGNDGNGIDFEEGGVGVDGMEGWLR